MSSIVLRGVGRRRAGIFHFLSCALAARRTRLALAELGDHVLDDIGVTRAEADAEARRSLWDVPAWWRG